MSRIDEWKRTDLTGEWMLCYLPNSQYRRQADHPTTLRAICQASSCIPAQVPGNFELDLQRAGIIGDPFFGQNVLDMQKLESMHLFYGRKFEYRKAPDCTPQLVFEGLDTVAEIFLNGKSIGQCENMLIAQRFDLSALLLDGENEIVVHISPACIAARTRKFSAANNALKYDYESLRLRKAASMFGWDIMPRIVSGGIWRPVYIEEQPAEFIRQAYLMTLQTNPEENTAELALFFDAEALGDDLSAYRISVRGRCGESAFSAEDRLWHTAGKLFIHLENARLWWPKGYGNQPLYDVEVTLARGDAILDQKRFRSGLRTVRLERTALTDTFFSGKFQFYVNERKIFILGSNFVPIDALHSRDRARLPEVLSLLEEIGCNAIRCWGGGVYEDDLLYDFCDEKGILIWQDFMMACGTYPIDDEFCQVMREEAEFIIRRLRQHPALLLWSGDNECDMSAFKKHPSGNRITRELLPGVVEYEDPTRPFLPSSPFIDREAEDKPEQYLPENHLWGPRDYYKSDFYRGSLCSFASEMGYHGCPSRISIERFIPADRLWPWQHNDDWMAHAASMELGEVGNFNYRIQLMADQIKELFGAIPDNLDEFVLASQISQAEAKKFFIEMFRLGQPHRTGIIWWNLIDGWPQFSDAVVDYYFQKKLAFYYIRQAQQPVLLAMREPDNWHIELAVINDTAHPVELRYTLKDALSGEALLEGRKTAAPGVKTLERVRYSQGEKRIYLMEWEQNGQKGRSHYLAGNPPFSLNEYRSFLDSIFEYGKGGVWKEL